MRKLVRTFRAVTVSWACVALLLPTGQLSAAGPPRPTGGADNPVVDLRLSDDGVLHGSLCDAVGRPVADQVVVLRQGSEAVARVTTDGRGEFAFRQLRGGLYQLTASGATLVCRVWTREAAPPTAFDALRLADGTVVVRGQQPLHCLLTNPWVLGAIIAAAIAIPIAVHEAQDDAS
jgi:hypothetical protein